MSRISRHGFSRAGFSLIELMMVVAIVGLLVGVASPQLQRWVNKGRQAEAKVALAAIYTRQMQFYSIYHSFHMGMSAIGYAGGGREWYTVSNCMVAAPSDGLWGGSVSGYFGASGPTFLLPSIVRFAHTANYGGCTTLTACSSVGSNPQVLRSWAIAQLKPGGREDVWVIDKSKSLQNCSQGF